MVDLSSDQKDEFKLSFKPSNSLLTMNHSSKPVNHGSADQQWISGTNTSMHFQSQFLNQSPSSMLLSDHTKCNISMFNPLNDNTNLLNSSNSRRLSSPTDCEVLFHETVPIVVKTSMMESNTRQLTLKIEKLLRIPQNQHILRITLTDESDPFFLYSLSVTENDFHQLKSDQTLLVDFAVFPKSLVLLLSQCLRSANDNHPKFVAVLVYCSSHAILCVQETNEFRHLQHISLKLQCASGDKLREYLGETLMIYKSSNTQYEHVLTETQQQLEGCKVEAQQSREYVASIKQKYEQCLCDLKTSHCSQMSGLKQNHLEQMEEIRKELMNSKSCAENEFKLELKTLNLKYNALKDNFDSISSDKLTLTSQLKNVTAKLQEMNELSQENKAELNELRRECKALDELKFKYEKQMNQDLIKIAALQQQIVDKVEIAQNNSHLLNSMEEQKKSMEEQMKLYRQNLEKSEKKVKECIKEINKGNNIISHLQNEIRNLRNKNKIKQQKIQSMQQLNVNKNDNMNRLKDECNKRDEAINKYKTESKELKDTLRACKDKLHESQKAIESNQRVISYLNKQLNDNQMNHNIFSNTHSTHSYNNAISGLTTVQPIIPNNINQNNANNPSISSYFPQ